MNHINSSPSASPKAGGNQCPNLKTISQRGSKFFFTQPFCSIQAFNRSHEAHLPIQMLISSGNILTDTPRMTFNQISGYPTVQSSGHIKLTTTISQVLVNWRGSWGCKEAVDAIYLMRADVISKHWLLKPSFCWLLFPPIHTHLSRFYPFW